MSFMTLDELFEKLGEITTFWVGERHLPKTVWKGKII